MTANFARAPIVTSKPAYTSKRPVAPGPLRKRSGINKRLFVAIAGFVLAMELLSGFFVFSSMSHSNVSLRAISEPTVTQASQLSPTPSVQPGLLFQGLSLTPMSLPTKSPTPRPSVSPTRSPIMLPTPSPSPISSVQPFLECVENNGGGFYTAFFGYNNYAGSGIYIPIGSNNQFIPYPSDRRQPQYFQPGSQPSIFPISFNGSMLVWQLGSYSVTASNNSITCNWHGWP